MKKNTNNDLLDLIILLKVFDANYVSDEDCTSLQGLDINSQADIDKAVELLLMPEFRTYKPQAQQRLMTILRTAIQEEKEDFSELFGRVNLVFDDEVIERQSFMRMILKSLESKI